MIDGCNIYDATRDSLHRTYGMVLQETSPLPFPPPRTSVPILFSSSGDTFPFVFQGSIPSPVKS